MALPPTFYARLTSARMLSPSVRELVFTRIDELPFLFEPGQWINLFLPISEPEARRAYSIASAPNGTPSFELAVTHVQDGLGSTYLHQLQVGEILRMNGPQGFFTRPLPVTTASLFVANGTGVTPLRSMIQFALNQGDKSPLWLLFGSRYEEDILYRNDFEQWAASHPNLQLFFTLSRSHAQWKGRTGHVQEHVPELWHTLMASQQGEPHAYICGLSDMVGAVRQILRTELNASRHQLHTERYD
ncbi:ferredoxin--NADP reductase [Pajaroellobacter abortibovis]|uniref:FAD-binding FR-type domain-containing protein n=1 Tax=Pajaroellobacter abortibovis TaxID=1882918 RepID=A0A1L6MV53_9BACT|nr:FAD-dependent oxidoreductase [Pajaroellobacter abortibovis]APR99392.1 hypothetical protein BCY86_00880 [Pajaroellobacter abortibovis]